MAKTIIKYKKWFIGQIKNENNEIIFSRRNFNYTRKDVLQDLRQRVCVDIPTAKSLIYGIKYSGGFNDSPYCLKKYYKDITKLKFIVEEE